MTKQIQPGSRELDACLLAEFPLLDYQRAWRLQKHLVQLRTSGRLQRDVLLMLEHRPVMTVGRRGAGQDLLVEEPELRARGIGIYHIERGGQVTYHGPGQLILYPIFDLRAGRLRLTEFVHRLEEIMLRIAADFGVRAERGASNRGVFVEDRKLGSLGVAVRRGVSYHGLALNVAVDLSPFELINPCGLAGMRMTSLNLESQAAVSLASARRYAQYHVHSVFQRECRSVSPDWLEAMAGAEHDPEPQVPKSDAQAPLA